MKILHINFKINDIYEDDTAIYTISFETNKPNFSINSGNNRNGYYLENKEENKEEFPDSKIIFYEGGFD